MLSDKMGRRSTPRYLSEEQDRVLAEEVSAGCFKTAGEIRDWIESEYEVSYKPGGVYSLLKWLGCSPMVPRGVMRRRTLMRRGCGKGGPFRAPQRMARHQVPDHSNSPLLHAVGG